MNFGKAIKGLVNPSTEARAAKAWGPNVKPMVPTSAELRGVHEAERASGNPMGPPQRRMPWSPDNGFRSVAPMKPTPEQLKGVWDAERRAQGYGPIQSAIRENPWTAAGVGAAGAGALGLGYAASQQPEPDLGPTRARKAPGDPRLPQHRPFHKTNADHSSLDPTMTPEIKSADAFRLGCYAAAKHAGATHDEAVDFVAGLDAKARAESLAPAAYKLGIYKVARDQGASPEEAQAFVLDCLKKKEAFDLGIYKIARDNGASHEEAQAFIKEAINVGSMLAHGAQAAEHAAPAVAHAAPSAMHNAGSSVEHMLAGTHPPVAGAAEAAGAAAPKAPGFMEQHMPTLNKGVQGAKTWAQGLGSKAVGPKQFEGQNWMSRAAQNHPFITAGLGLAALPRVADVGKAALGMPTGQPQQQTQGGMDPEMMKYMMMMMLSQGNSHRQPAYFD